MNNPAGSGTGTNSASTTSAMRSVMSHSAAPSGPSSVDMIEVVDLDSPAAAAAAATLGEDDVIAVTGSSVPSSSWPPVAAGGGGGGGMQLNGTAVLSESVSWCPSQQGTLHVQESSFYSTIPALLSICISSFLAFFSIPPTTHLRRRQLRRIPTQHLHLRRHNPCPTSSWRPALRPRDTSPWPLQAQNWFRPLTMT